MRLSVFNLYVADYPEPGETLVHNTFSGGFAPLGAAAMAALQKADAGEELSEAERSFVDPALFDDSVGILVESREAEERAYRDWFERKKTSTHQLHAIVAVTFACNLDCTYCCQSDVLDGTMMREDTGADTAAWLAARALEIGAREVVLDFVGGEPLLNPERIEQIATEVRRRIAGKGITLTFGLITNGVFLTRDLVERWIPLGLTRAQVTIDGDETTHSITRRSKKRGDDSFAATFANVVEAAERITITIKGNYQRDTVHGFVPLLEKLRGAGLPRGSRIVFSPALTALGAPSDSASGSCSWSGSSPELMIALSDEVHRAGFAAPDPMAVGPCGFHSRHTYAVDPEGHLYKCPGFLGHAVAWAIGHVSSGLTDRYEQLAGVPVQDGCGSCAHRPDCAGGCVASTWLKAERVDGMNCEIEYFDRYKGPLLQRRYALAASATVEEALKMFPPAPVRIPALPPEAPPTRGRPAALRVLR